MGAVGAIESVKMPAKDRETNNRHQREWYYRNREKKIVENKVREDKLREQLRKLKEETPCADCGINYPYYVMDFDHAGADKVNSVARLQASNVYAAIREAAKCEIVCANCHRIRSHKERTTVVECIHAGLRSQCLRD